MPYYPNPAYVNAPNATGGLVILPHLTCDWETGRTVNHRLNTHPIDAYRYFENFTASRLFIEALIEARAFIFPSSLIVLNLFLCSKKTQEPELISTRPTSHRGDYSRAGTLSRSQGNVMTGL